LEGDRLFCLSPWLPGEETPRTMFVSKEVYGIVRPPFTNDGEGRCHARLRALLDGFVQGEDISVSEDPRNKPTDTILARTDPISAEVWDFRCFDPHPGIRLFGRFSELDHFIALTWDYRENVDWNREIARCQDTWRDLFGGLDPLIRRNIDGYVSSGFHLV
jgi:hypothetical protein